jgi:hypothetical protein
MEILIAEQGAFCFEPMLSADEARGRAGAQKAAAFGTLARLFSRPKDEDITVEDQGLRYIPLWHAKAHLRFVYDRRESYKVPIKTPYVKVVTIAANDYPVSGSGSVLVELPVVEHCERDQQKELWLDAVTSQPVNAQPYLKAHVAEVVLDTFAPEGAQIEMPTVRASAVIRTLLGNDLQPADADEVKEQEVNVDCIDLYFRPAYAFKYAWAAKNKTAEVAIDGITGELKAEPSAASAALGKLLKPETLFDIGAETLNLVVPGGAIALKVAKAIADKQKSS